MRITDIELDVIKAVDRHNIITFHYFASLEAVRLFGHVAYTIEHKRDTSHRSRRMTRSYDSQPMSSINISLSPNNLSAWMPCSLHSRIRRFDSIIGRDCSVYLRLIM